MFKAPLKLLALSAWILLFIPFVWLAHKLKKTSIADRLVRLCYAGNLHIVGVRLRVHGDIDARRPLLLVTNHLSYLDVLVLGSLAPVRFTPKSDIGGWPIIGGICRLTRCVFIDRRPEKFNDMKETVRQRLAKGEIVTVFPEATTGNGIHLLPFKSALFSLAEERVDGRELLVQPAAITYTHIRKLPIDSTQWPRVAWYGDMHLLPHLVNLLRLGPISAEFTFLPAITISQSGDRKRMAEECQRMIAQALGEIRKQPYSVEKREAFSLVRCLRLRRRKND